MNSFPLVSVVLSVYNGEKYLAEAITSILEQTYEHFEFIIINDGSTDKSLEIIKSYDDKRIVLISRENRGLIESLNEGIKEAKGKYIARMDADDISLLIRFEEQIRLMEKNKNVGVCGSWIEVFGDNRSNTLSKIPEKHDELKTRLLFSVPVAHPSVMIRKSVIDRYNLKYKKEYKNAEDYKFWLDFSKYTKFYNIQKVLLKYRYLETSISRVADNSECDTRFKIISSIFTEILYELNLQNTELENKLHFTIALNKRILKEYVDLKVLDIYFTKVIKANKEVKYFNDKYLIRFLSKKFLIVAFLQIKAGNYQLFKMLSSKYFYVSIWVMTT